MKKGGFFISNWAYLIWFALYFTIVWLIIGETWKGFLITTAIYAVFIGIALSPLGEFLLRFLMGAKPPATQREREFLLPLFEEVYEAALENNPKLNKNIHVFITDDMYINAFAIGRQTVAVTRGLLETMNTEEIKGVLAHEFGHITHGDTKALLLQNIGNGFFAIILAGIRMILRIIKVICSSDEAIMGRIIVGIFEFILNIYVFLFVLLGDVILSLNSRRSEYLADGFAYNIGYGEHLIEALYILQKMDMGQKIPLRAKITASHPHLSARIERLENMYE